MAEVLPSSPHYVADGPVDEGNKNFFSISPPQSRTSVFRVLNRSASRNPIDEQKVSMAVRGRRESGGVSTAFSICKGDTSVSEADSGNEGGNNDQPWIVAVLLTTFRRSLVSCRPNAREDRPNMEISWPTNVQHVAHVTFDRFNGFLGLPVEFEMEIPRRAPSASASVFGVSAESMQLSYDSRGNSVPTILLLMQERLYSQGGLRAEGIFRINAENSQEENVRDQLNKGIVPDDIDVHCLAGLIKAWFRELPTGVLDTLTPEQVLQCNEEKQCVELVKLLPPTEVALLNWAVNLMTDVVQEQEYNKMNARNIAMVFAPNMTQMSDPLTALMHAVQVMNFLKTLILKTLREREEAAGTPTLYCGYSNDEDSYDSTPQTSTAYRAMDVSDEDDHTLESGEYLMDSYSRSSDEDTPTMYTEDGFLSHMYVRDISDEESSRDSLFDIYDSSNVLNEVEQKILGKTAIFQFKKENGLLFLESPQERASTSEEDASLLAMDSSDKNLKTDVEELKANTKEHSQNVVQMIQAAVRTRGSVVNTIDQQIERVEAW